MPFEINEIKVSDKNHEHKHFHTVQSKHRNDEHLPDVVDVYGAALGIVRLWCTCRYNLFRS